MVDRFLVWLSVSTVTAGVSMAVLTGAAIATADDGAPAGSGDSTSESSGSSEGQRDSEASTPNSGEASSPPADGLDDDEAKDEDAKDDADSVTSGDDEGVEEEPAQEEPAEEAPVDGEPVEEQPADEVPGEDSATDDRNGSSRDVVRAERTEPVNDAPTVNESFTTAPAVGKAPESEAVDPATDAVPAESVVTEPESVVLDVPADIIDAPEAATVAFAAAASPAVTTVATASPLTALLDVIGTVVFNLYALATRLVGGPPILPPGSTVTVRSSTLRVDCGCAPGQGFDVPADWYIPKAVEGQAPPQRLIYLQHGFLASGPWYSHTAAALAEQTNSIVVAPSITSNFLDADACWLGAAPMHEAMAELFDPENTALADSAIAAGYTDPLPYRVVLMGHSLGGGAVSGMAGYMADNDDEGRLAGVVLLDGVGLNDAMADDLKKVSLSIPIYQLAAPKYFWNQFGVGTTALREARPNADFIGVTLVDGSHVDTMVGGNPLIQFSQQLVSGFSTPQNVAAARRIMVGWVNDMFAGNEATGIYEDDLDEPISTPAGDATAVALPNDLTKPFLFNFLQPFVSLGNGIFTFEPACVAASTGRAAAGSCSGSLAA